MSLLRQNTWPKHCKLNETQMKGKKKHSTNEHRLYELKQSRNKYTSPTYDDLFSPLGLFTNRSRYTPNPRNGSNCPQTPGVKEKTEMATAR